MKQKRPRTACERAGAFRCLAFQALRMHRESCPPWEIARERRKFLLNSFQKGQWPWRLSPVPASSKLIILNAWLRSVRPIETLECPR